MMEDALDSLAGRFNACWHYSGTAIVFWRDGWQLSHAGERQTLPTDSSPLLLLSSAICGQGWNEAEVREFAAIVEAQLVFERPGTWMQPLD